MTTATGDYLRGELQTEDDLLSELQTEDYLLSAVGGPPDGYGQHLVLCFGNSPQPLAGPLNAHGR
jgi:hypothetical protein